MVGAKSELNFEGKLKGRRLPWPKCACVVSWKKACDDKASFKVNVFSNGSAFYSSGVVCSILTRVTSIKYEAIVSDDHCELSNLFLNTKRNIMPSAHLVAF